MSGQAWGSELQQAQLLLREPGSLAHHRLRMACWLLRFVLEQSLAELARRQEVDVHGASGRTTLICLRVLYREVAPELAGEAEGAWTRLSQAVHHHAYELSPTVSEVEELEASVVRIAEYAGRTRS